MFLSVIFAAKNWIKKISALKIHILMELDMRKGRLITAPTKEEKGRGQGSEQSYWCLRRRVLQATFSHRSPRPCSSFSPHTARSIDT
jgi:hypothetical protein